MLLIEMQFKKNKRTRYFLSRLLLLIIQPGDFRVQPKVLQLSVTLHYLWSRKWIWPLLPEQWKPKINPPTLLFCKPPWIQSSNRFCISKAVYAGSCSGRSIYISAGVRMCVNEFLLRRLQKKRHSVSSGEIIDTDTSRIGSISHQFLCLTCTVCSAHSFRYSNSFCNPLKTPLSDWSILAVTKEPIVLGEKSAYLAHLLLQAGLGKCFK